MDPACAIVIQLLQSTTKHSTDQLRALLEETIKQRYGESKSLASLNAIREHSKKELVPVPKFSFSSTSARKESSRTTEKKRIEPAVETVEPGSPVKPPPDVVKVKPASVREPEAVKEVATPMEIDNGEDDDDDDDDDDLALEILEDDLSCVVCRGMSVGVCNQLVECLECHSLYHQECHQPPVAKADINDPRWAWYCASCTKAINKQPSKSRSSPKTDLASGSSQPSSQVSSKTSQKAVPEPVQNLFKRQDKGSSGSSSSKSPINPPSSMGMAGLAASYLPTPASTSGSTSSSKSSSASSSSSSKVPPPKVVTTVISADKRLANMKRKAAKQQEKRKHIK